MGKKSIIAVTLLMVLFTGLSCGSDEPETGPDIMFRDRGLPTPDFSAENTFQFIERQLEFGPRVPSTQSHWNTRNFLMDTLRGFAGDDRVFAQDFTQVVYGDTLRMSNIIAVFNPEASDRVLLCAHWDTRPRADNDPDPARRDEPIPGADDGASGVAVLLELARLMSEEMPRVGVDIILFDGEDYGHENDLDHYFLGARYWTQNPPVPGYSPRFGILLDMVGGENALFPKEGYSMAYASRVVDEVWSIAADKGYDDLFLNERGRAIADDHWILNQSGLPTINIIHQARDGDGWNFPPYWHKHADDIDIIDKSVLQRVGDVLVELLYNRM